MLQKLKIRGIKWVDGVDLDKAEIYKLVKKYDFHELDIEACMEENQRARIDTYEDYLFMVLHFPKYNEKLKIYELNEFNIFLGKNFLITLRSFNGTKTSGIFENYQKLDLEDNSEFKLTPGFILYEIIQAMLEKMFKFGDNIKRDLKILEKQVFENTTSSLVKEIMIKKRNIVVMKHMLLPQISVMRLMENSMNKMFQGEIEEYFEDLEDKIAKVVNDVKILEEHVDSIEDAFKTIIDIKTNNIITFLAIFSAFFLPLTLITSFYGMNITLPFETQENTVYMLLLFVSIFMMGMYLIFKKKGKF